MDKKAKSPEEFFEAVNIGEFTDKVREFRKQISPRMSEKEIFDSLHKTLTNNGDLFIEFVGSHFEKDTYFFRVREYREDDTSLKTESGFWNKPKEDVKEWGRFNRPGVSKLYTAAGQPVGHQGIVLEEMRYITEHKKFVLIAYKAKKPISTFSFGSIKYDHFTNKNAKNVAKLYHDFLQTELTRDVGEGKEYLYKISTIITELFNIQPTIDAFVYPCVARKDVHNTCFSGENVKDLLDFQWAMLMVKLGSDYLSTSIVESFTEKGEAIYRENPLKIPESKFCLPSI